MNAMMFKEAPSDWKKDARDIVGCYLQHDGKFVLLHRHAHKSNGDTRGLPAGKTDEGEARSSAMRRELREETGIDVPEDKLPYLRMTSARSTS
jgi:8-oxo-dGTP pyrophosphatase MutT (NUDIX family)